MSAVSHTSLRLQIYVKSTSNSYIQILAEMLFFFPYNYFSFQSNHFNSFNTCTIINYNDGPTIVFLLRIPKTNHACSLMIDSLQVSLQTPKPLLPTENTKQNTGLQRWTNSNSVLPVTRNLITQMHLSASIIDLS